MNIHPSLDTLLLALPSLGWNRINNPQGGLELWVPGSRAKIIGNQDDPLNTLYVPTDLSAPDFSFNMTQVLDSLIRISSINVQEELAMAEYRLDRQMDEFELRSNSSSKSGILPWQEGVNLINGARSILDASARASQNFDRRFVNQNSTIATNFLDGCYMGQTKVGSYIVTALVPATHEFATTTSKKKTKNIKLTGRTISETLISSLKAAHEATEVFAETSDSEAFEWGVSQGLSYELFVGINEVIGQDETEMTVEFLPLESRIDSNPKRVSIAFDQNHKAAVEKGIEILGKKSGPREVHLSGEVTTLTRKVDDPGSAHIKLKTIIGGKTKTYNVKLSDKDYDAAMEAHRSRVQLEVNGNATQSTVTDIKSIKLTNAPVGGIDIESSELQEALF